MESDLIVKPKRARLFQYVPHSKVAYFEARGWVFAADLGEPHRNYAVLMEWLGEKQPPEPKE